MNRQSLDVLVQKYLQCNPLSDSEDIAARREYVRRELKRWQYMYEHGCSDPAWPDGCNLNITRNHILAVLHELQNLGADVSREYVPPEVDDGLMIPAGMWYKTRIERFKRTGQRVRIASIEISLF